MKLNINIRWVYNENLGSWLLIIDDKRLGTHSVLAMVEKVRDGYKTMLYVADTQINHEYRRKVFSNTEDAKREVFRALRYANGG